MRLYYVRRGEVLIVMLGGGDKSSQSADITNAVKLATPSGSSEYLESTGLTIHILPQAGRDLQLPVPNVFSHSHALRGNAVSTRRVEK